MQQQNSFLNLLYVVSVMVLSNCFKDQAVNGIETVLRLIMSRAIVRGSV